MILFFFAVVIIGYFFVVVMSLFNRLSNPDDKIYRQRKPEAAVANPEDPMGGRYFRQ